MSGFSLTRGAVRRQLAALPYPLYEVRLVHHATRRPWPGERLWPASQILNEGTIKFLRIRNRDGYDVYLRPYAGAKNAGYILLDLDAAAPSILSAMGKNGHDPCLLVETSPGNLQAWIHVNTDPLEPAVATALARRFAHTYGGDVASADWRHLGRLAGFTNQKPERRLPGGWAPWATIVCIRPGSSHDAQEPLQTAPPPVPTRLTSDWSIPSTRGDFDSAVAPQPTMPAAQAAAIYRAWMDRLQIAKRFPHPDWSIVDSWIARGLLLHGTPAAKVRAVLQFGSPSFPRRHADPDDYLRRTIARVAFPAPQGALCLELNTKKTTGSL